jgi:endo-1,4-beta-xylanase
MNAKRLLTVLLVLFFAFGGVVCIQAADTPSLKTAFGPHFLIGAALNDDVVSGKDPESAAIVIQQCNTVTAENVMKWMFIHPEPDRYDFAAADRFVAFAEKNKMQIIGHTLVWHAQIPKSAFQDAAGNLLGRDAMLARLKQHIETVMGRYKGKVKGWDVVNEALTDDGKLQPCLWLKTVGEDYVAKAFEFAAQADPSAELYYNDYSLDKPAKRDAAVRLVRDLKARGLRIDAVGIQGHWGLDYPTTDDLTAFIDSVAALGVKVLVTEMDMNILPAAWNYQGADISKKAELRAELNPYPETLPDTMQTVLANRYAELFTILLKRPGVVGRVTFWGVTDRTSWLNNWPVFGRTAYPLLFDRSFRPKPAFHAVLRTAQAGK